MKPASHSEKVRLFALGFLLSAIIFCLLVALGVFVPSSAVATSAQPVFSPNSEPQVIDFLNSAQNSIDVEMYIFSSKNVADALVQKAQSGVKVRVIVELRTDSGASLVKMIQYLKDGGVDVRFASSGFQLTHSKMVVVDGKKVLLGSINFSKSALTKNREAAVIISGPISSDFESVFEQDWGIGSAA